MNYTVCLRDIILMLDHAYTCIHIKCLFRSESHIGVAQRLNKEIADSVILDQVLLKSVVLFCLSY